MEKITEIWERLMANVPNVVEALLLLIIAFLCAAIVKYLAYKTMHLLKVDVAFDKAKMDNNKKTSLKDFIASVLYLITFALFVPGIFQKLGLTGVAEPVVNMMNKFLGYLPNILAALIILIIGLCVAKAIKELLIPILRKMKVDSCLEKVGLEASSKVSTSEVLANVVYVLVLIPVVIASLDALKIEAISKPATEMLNNVLTFMPRVVVAIVILFVGKFIADLVQGLLEKVLLSIGTDKVSDNIMKKSDTKISKDFSLSKAISYLVKYVIVIFFFVEGLNILKLEVLTNIGNSIISYMPYAISSAIILGIAILLGNLVESAINSKFENNRLTALIVKVIIITIGAFITIYQLGIAKTLVNSTFIIILGAFAVAFAVSFGIGGRDFAKHMLQKVEDKLDKKPVTKAEPVEEATTKRGRKSKNES